MQTLAILLRFRLLFTLKQLRKRPKTLNTEHGLQSVFGQKRYHFPTIVHVQAGCPGWVSQNNAGALCCKHPKRCKNTLLKRYQKRGVFNVNAAWGDVSHSSSFLGFTWQTTHKISSLGPSKGKAYNPQKLWHQSLPGVHRTLAAEQLCSLIIVACNTRPGVCKSSIMHSPQTKNPTAKSKQPKVSNLHAFSFYIAAAAVSSNKEWQA